VVVDREIRDIGLSVGISFGCEPALVAGTFADAYDAMDDLFTVTLARKDNDVPNTKAARVRAP